jgi:exopolysaccharide biosynthesis polyprenyl glycosylphosphotransferase
MRWSNRTSGWRAEAAMTAGSNIDVLPTPPTGLGTRTDLRAGLELGAERARPGFARGRVRALLITDVLAIVLSLAGTFVAAELVGPPAIIAPGALIAALVPLATLGWIAIFAMYGLYEAESRVIAPNSFDEVARLFSALLAGSLLYLIVGQGVEKFTGWFIYSPLEGAFLLTFAMAIVPTLRGAVRTWLVPAVVRPRRTLIVGAGSVGQTLRRKIEAHPEYGLQLAGFVDDDLTASDDVVGCTEDLTRLVDELEIEWVLLASAGAEYEQTLDRVRAVRRPDVHLSIVPNYFELFASNATIEDLEGIPIVSLPPLRLSRSVVALKRSADIAVSAAGLLVLAPLFALVAALIKLDTSGPVLFRQSRVGRGGAEFRIVKFRTMIDDAESRRFELQSLNDMEGDGPLFKIKEDPRITRVGRFLRRTSVDELPQLWNVLKGEMSLVGPRPFVVHESDQITGWAGRRLETTPGITGLWQVLGRNDLPFAEMVKLDYIYVTNWSLWWDVKILCQTIPVILGRRGC